MQCHKLLNIPTSIFIKDTSIIPRLPKDKNMWVNTIDPKLFLTTDAYNKLSILGRLNSLIFEMKPNVDKNNIHIDLLGPTLEPVLVGLNIVLEGQGVMKWYVPEKDGYVINRTTPKITDKAWFNNYGEPVDIWDKGKIALVRTDVAHQVWNFDNVNRQIVTIRWDNKISWEETIEWFNRNFPND
jgi:hypothetical protein